MNIRKAHATDDFLAISTIYQQGWQTAYAGIIPESYLKQIKPDRWVPYLKADFNEMFLLELNQKIIGVATYGQGRDQAWETSGELKSIYLNPAFKNLGYGSQLLQVTLGELKKKYRTVYLWVLADNWPSRHFYEKNGFKIDEAILQIKIGGKHLIEVRYVLTF